MYKFGFRSGVLLSWCFPILSALWLGAASGLTLLAAPPISSHITGVWANEGGDKVTPDELRVSQHRENLTGHVLNRAWNGQTILLFGAANEVVNFNLVLEAAAAQANQVSVTFDTLSGPQGNQIHSIAAQGNGVMNWVNRPIELFYVRYLPIHGLSFFSYPKNDERQVPVRLQRPWSGNGVGTGGWTDRPDHDKSYPDIYVPLELASPFTIAAGQNQSIWSDIYIPKTAAPGVYTGTVTVREAGVVTYQIPVQLTVQGFSLPDEPTSKTMLYVDGTDIMWRYITGWRGYANWLSDDGARIVRITDKYFELLHRHKIAAIGENECPFNDRPCATTVPRLDGSLFTAAHGYDGPGVGTPTGIFSIGTYGTWGWNQIGIPAWRWDEGLFWQHTDNYANWFNQNLPGAEYIFYLQDEPAPQDFAQVDTWARWIHENPGPGRQIKSMTTHTWFDAQTTMPNVDIPTSVSFNGSCPDGIYDCDVPTLTQAAADFYRTTPGKDLWMYNDCRVCAGTAMTEDDGVSMRVSPWAQYKKQIHRWFYWYANVLMSPQVSDDPFQNAVTWGNATYFEPTIGWTGDNGTSNGAGLLLYPGHSVYLGHTDYGVDGPIASLRLKEWRRGIQDTDYLALAARYEPDHVNAILARVVPNILWEYPNRAPDGYNHGAPSWSTDPDVWEEARAELAQIITQHCASASAAGEANSPCTTIPGIITSPVIGGNTPTSTVTTLTTAPSSTPTNSTPTPLLFVPLAPCRLVDTRTDQGTLGGPALVGGGERAFPLLSSSCNLPASALAYALNVTVVPHGKLRWLTLWPSGQSRPFVSTLNAPDGRTKANAVVMAAGIGGGVSAYATEDTELILDVTGYFVPGSPQEALAFYPVTPCRVLDTRQAPNALGGPALTAQQERRFPILSSACGLPDSARAFSLNYTVVPKQRLRYLTAWPSGTPQPNTSILNAVTGAVTANAAFTPAGDGGELSVYATDSTDLIVDVNGYFAPPANGGLSFYALSPCRSFDSRTSVVPTLLEGQQTLNLADSSCGPPTNAEALLLNATVVPPQQLGWLTLWSANASQPLVSTLNAYDGQVTSNAAVVPANLGSIHTFTKEPTHLILDLFGYFAP